MIVRITKVIHAEIPESAFNDLEGALKEEDYNIADVLLESDFDKEGKVVTYLVIKQVTELAIDTTGEYKGSIVKSVTPISDVTDLDVLHGSPIPEKD